MISYNMRDIYVCFVHRLCGSIDYFINFFLHPKISGNLNDMFKVV